MPTSVRTNLFTDPFCGDEAYLETGTAGGSNTTGTVQANPSGSGFRVTAPASGAAWRSPLRHSTLAVSTTYTVRMMITSTTSTTNMTFVHRPNANIGTGTGSVTIGTPPLVAGVPYEFVATFTTTSTTIPAGSSGVGIVTTVFQVGNVVTIDGLVIRQGTFTAAQMQPFDGSVADTQALTYAWTGATNASTSTETFSWQDVALSSTAAISASGGGLQNVSLTAPASLSVDTLDSDAVSLGLSAAISGTAAGLDAVAVEPLVVAIGVELLPKIVGTVGDRLTFSYWEKRRKDFGPEASRRDHMPFRLQSYPEGKTIVRYADGTLTPVQVVTEELEALEGIRIFYGGKANLVTEAEADELVSGGYGDYLSQQVGDVDLQDAYNQGAYNEGDYGA